MEFSELGSARFVVFVNLDNEYCNVHLFSEYVSLSDFISDCESDYLVFELENISGTFK